MKTISKISIIIILFIRTINLFSQENNIPDFSIKCGTFNNTEQVKKEKLKIKEKFQNDAFSSSTISSSGRFVIHYDTMGIDAVANKDINKNGIPDWIDTVCDVFDEVYEIEVEQLGYRKPRTYYNSSDTLYHIYVIDCASRQKVFYAVTTPEDTYTDNSSKWNLATSSITIDNDYSPNDTYINELGNKVPVWGTTGVNGLKVTAAHEFHHACQFMYAETVGWNQAIYEMSAVAMELVVYPELKDYQYYTNNLLNNINLYNFGYWIAENGYPFGVFFYQMIQKYAPIKEYWEMIANDGTYFYETLEKFFNNYGSTLEDEWMTFIDYLYYCGQNSIPDYGFPFAKELITPKPNVIINNYGIHSADLIPYQLYYAQFLNKKNDFFILSDTADLIITNANTAEVINNEKEYNWIAKNCSFGSFEEQQNENNKNCFPNYWLNIYPNFGGIKYACFLKNGGEIFAAENVFPMPFDKHKNIDLCIPIADDVKIGDKLELNIFTNNDFVENMSLIATNYNEKRVVKFDARYLTPGVYIYSLEHFGNSQQGKFVIK